MQNLAGSGYELKLAHALILNAAIIAGAYRFARRRFGGDAIASSSHALLGWFLVQYVCVGALGLCGVLGATSLTVGGFAMAAALWAGGGRRDQMTIDATRALDRYLTWGCFLFLAGYAWAVLDYQWPIPPVADDALTYHLPAAVRWMQSGRLVLHETWYFNPANTYSPLAGSMFAAWWIAPFGNDVAARFVQAPALALVFFALIESCRRMGVSAAVAAPVALAAVLSRPFASQVVMPKDDLYLAAFFLAAVASMDVATLKSPQRTWVLAVSIGLFLATKITALLAAPIVLVAVDALFRARLRPVHWIVLVAVPTLLAGPWFARNWVVTGNPLYPTDVGPFEGMFRPGTSERLRSFAGLKWVVTESYFRLPVVLVALTGLGWVAAAALRGRRVIGDPLVRTAVVGPVVGFVVFAWLAPFPEVRFLNPTYLLLFAAFAVGCEAIPIHPVARLAGPAAALAVSLTTNLPTGNPAMFAAVGFAAAPTGLLVVAVRRRWPRKADRILAGGAAAAVVVLFLVAYVNLNALVNAYAFTTHTSWENPGYARVALGQSWTFVREKTPADGTIAYANTHFTYPLFGFDHRRRVVYAPVRSGMTHLHDLPKIAGRVPGEHLQALVVRNMNDGADPDVWLKNLEALGADHLYVAKGKEEPPESRFARSLPARFTMVFDNEAAVVFRITR